MNYYKLINNSDFIGIATSYDFRRYQKKHNIILTADERSGQYIQIGDLLYHDVWLCPISTDTIPYTDAQIISIDKEEYDLLQKSVKAGEEVILPPTLDEDVEEDMAEEVDPTKEATLDFVKEQKIKEMTSMSNKAIIDGFEMELDDGSIRRFTLTKENRLSIYSLQSILLSGQTSIPYMDNDSCILLSTTEIQNLLTKANNHTIYNKLYLNSLKSYIKSLNDISVISEIYYGIDIPEEYQIDILKQLALAKRS